LRASGTRSIGRVAAPAIFARLVDGTVIEAHVNGEIVARFDGYSVRIGAFGAGVVDRLDELRTGLPLDSLESKNRNVGKEIELLLRRLTGYGLLEYRLARSRRAEDLVVIEPQIFDYWPRTPQLGNADKLVLSRFAYTRRRGHAMVLESPRAGALFRIGDPKLVTLLAKLSTPQQVKELQLRDGSAEIAFLALLVACQMIVDSDAANEGGAREDDHDLAVWEFHDLLFHARSTQGRHANAVGGVYPHVGLIPPLPAVRPAWPEKQIALGTFLKSKGEQAAELSPVAKSLRERHSTRSFDDRRPITFAELSQFLDLTARVLSRSDEPAGGDSEGTTVRPYPSAGASYELELYLTVNTCEGLPRGFYHYDAGAHALTPISAPADALDGLLAGAAQAMGVPAAPQILITIAARFGRVSWKYSSIAYALILKDAGVLTQMLYLTAAELGLGGCAIGIANIDLFARMTGIEFHVEGPVGQFALGRGAKSDASN
jgi:SagB-type dehydrogenase family enzyme